MSVRAGSKAWEAGLRQGDIITSVNQRPVADLDEFAAQVKGQFETAAVELDPRSERPCFSLCNESKRGEAIAGSGGALRAGLMNYGACTARAACSSATS